MDTKLYEDRKLKDVQAHYFTGPISGDFINGFKTLPHLLRKVANWMEANNFEDQQLRGFSVGTVFPAENSDEWYHTATVYYDPDPQACQIKDQEN